MDACLVVHYKLRLFARLLVQLVVQHYIVQHLYEMIGKLLNCCVKTKAVYTSVRKNLVNSAIGISKLCRYSIAFRLAVWKI